MAKNGKRDMGYGIFAKNGKRETYLQINIKLIMQKQFKIWKAWVCIKGKKQICTEIKSFPQNQIF